MSVLYFLFAAVWFPSRQEFGLGGPGASSVALPLRLFGHSTTEHHSPALIKGTPYFALLESCGLAVLLCQRQSACVSCGPTCFVSETGPSHNDHAVHWGTVPAHSKQHSAAVRLRIRGVVAVVGSWMLQ